MGAGLASEDRFLPDKVVMRMQTRELFNSLASRSDHLDNDTLTQTVDALLACEQATAACASGMLAEKEVDELRMSIDRDLDCADIAVATRRVLTRGSNPETTLLAAQLQACVLACQRSHESCDQHVQHACALPVVRGGDRAGRSGLQTGHGSPEQDAVILVRSAGRRSHSRPSQAEPAPGGRTPPTRLPARYGTY